MLKIAVTFNDMPRRGKGRGAEREDVVAVVCLFDCPESMAAHGFTKPTAPVVREVSIPETITVAELASKNAVKAAMSSGDVQDGLYGDY